MLSRAAVALLLVVEAAAAATPLEAKIRDAEARLSLVEAKMAAFKAHRDGIVPALKPVSDKKFFDGKKADYPTDKRPTGGDHFRFPYPIVQEDTDYDKDYVADENSDRGEWDAHMTYDTLRSRYNKEKADVDKAKAKETEEENEHEKKVEKEKKAAEETAKAEADAAKAKADEEKAASDKKKTDAAVSDQDAVVKKEEQDFEACKRELAEAKAQLKKLMDEKNAFLLAKKEKAERDAWLKGAAVKKAEEALKLRAEKSEKKEDPKKRRAENLKKYNEAKKEAEEVEKRLEKATAKLRSIRQEQVHRHEHLAFENGVTTNKVAIAALCFALVAWFA